MTSSSKEIDPQYPLAIAVSGLARGGHIKPQPEAASRQPVRAWAEDGASRHNKANAAWCTT